MVCPTVIIGEYFHKYNCVFLHFTLKDVTDMNRLFIVWCRPYYVVVVKTMCWHNYSNDYASMWMFVKLHIMQLKKICVG